MATSQLSQRETEVFELAILGLSNDEIAARLAISRRTVETHLRTVFHKTGVTRRAQLVALYRDEAPPAVPSQRGTAADHSCVAADAAAPARNDDHNAWRLELYEAAVRRLVDRQFPLFEERVELTVNVGERDGQDTVVERRWTTPKPYLVHRMLRPIVAWNDGPPADPDDLALSCDVHGQDIQADVNPMLGADGLPLLMVLFQPGLRTVTEWTLHYRSPGLWSPLRDTGTDTLTWATATQDMRHRPMVDHLTVKIVFPRGWEHVQVVEQDDRGTTAADRLPTGETQVTWQDRRPVAAAYRWLLRTGADES